MPKARSLASALKSESRGDTRVVCQRGSLKRAIRSINRAHTKGYVLRPSQGTKKLSARNARRLKRQNRAFFKRCKFKSIQTAIKRSHNNDRVIVMPGQVHRAEVARQADQRPEVRPVQGGVGRRAPAPRPSSTR